LEALLWARTLERTPVALEPTQQFLAFCTILPQNLHFSLNDMQNAKIPKLAKKKLETNKGKGLTSAN
jgi:hypothetical protein